MTTFTPSQLWRFHNLGEELVLAPDPELEAKTELEAKPKPATKPKPSEEEK